MFAIMVVTLGAEPILAAGSASVAEAANVVLALVYLYVLFVVFDERRGRQIAYILFAPMIASSCALYAVAPGREIWAAATFHATAVVFLGYAVVAVLRGLFRSRTASVDAVFGAVCGYLLGGLAWGHLYALAYMIRPQAFAVSEAIAAQVNDLHRQTPLFNYLSFATLTTLGYGDITPVGPPLYSLTWLEVVFAQFYIAVIVAQLVGMRLAQAAAGDDASRR